MAQPRDAVEDKGGLAPHKNRCPHVFNALSIPDDLSLKLQAISLQNDKNGQVTCSMGNCDCGECWLCLKCHAILCGRYGNQHMVSHCASYTSHCMAMGINDLSFWCYKCQNYINHLSVKKVWDFYSIAHIARFSEPIPPALIKKTTFNQEETNTFTMEAIQESEDDKNDDIDVDDIDIDALFDDETNVHPNDCATNITIDLIDTLLSTFSLSTPTPDRYNKTALFYHPDCLLHKPGRNRSHVERPERCSTSYQMLNDYGILKDLIEIAPREATKQELGLTHSNKHVEIIIGNNNSNGWYDGDTFYNEHSSRAAKLSAGATIDLMSGILQKKFNNGFALVRPPGHHCEHHKPMGFCLFNNAVVAVNCIRNKGLCSRVLIVDWDVHHGNGTQNMFYDDCNVLYFSTHRHDHGFFYPGTGKANECGSGFNINVPLNTSGDKGHGDKEYLLIWKDVLLPICRSFKPEIILVSAGFDACIGDPLGDFRITPPCYGLLTRLLLNECSNVAIVLEGGYNLSTMPRAICCCNYALLKGPFKQKDDYDVDEFYTEFKENITDGGGWYNVEYEAFHQWFDEYGDELIDKDYRAYLKQYQKKKNITSNIGNEEDFTNYGSCKRTIKQVLKEHKKYWKCVKDILKEYSNVADSN